MPAAIARLALIPAAAVAIACLPHAAAADVVTGTVTPQGAKVVIVDTSGATVGQLKSGPYQLQLPVGKYKARCEAPKPHEQDFLSLSEPVTVNIDCGQ
jgi:hypothetical protein